MKLSKEEAEKLRQKPVLAERNRKMRFSTAIFSEKARISTVQYC